MRKVLLSLAVLASSVVSAQLLNVGSVEKVNLPAGADAIQSVLSHDGSFAVINSANGLQKVDLATGKVAKIADNASSSGIEISEDGATIVYKQSVFKNKLRYTTLKSVNINNGKESTIVNASRNLQGYALSKNSVGAVDNGQYTGKSLDSAAPALVTVASIKNGALYVSVNGVNNNISPQGTTGQSYLWPSISPDGKKVLYYLCGQGAFVCNLDGSNPVSVGMIRAAKWYNNEVVVGMQDQDNGEYVTASKLTAVSVDGKVKQDLTQYSSMAMYPAVAGNGSKVSFVTPAGELFVMNIK